MKAHHPSPINEVLEQTCVALNIPRSKAEEAKSRYEAVGSWLERPNSTIRDHSPRIYPQGSFELGTVIKPISDEEEYDIDIVCSVETAPSNWTQKDLKDRVGDEIKSYAKAQSFNEAPTEGKRCWTLNYANDARFHLDVLPAITDSVGMRLLLERNNYGIVSHIEHAISITDKTHANYEAPHADWPRSNPKGYANWFRVQMQLAYQRRKMAVANFQESAVEGVSDYDVKTPLQQSIQLLKRHRDSMFQKDPENKPISIIVSTLAAHAYNNEETIEQALKTILENMDQHIIQSAGICVIANPVNPMENFADKWPDHPKRKANFFNWLERARLDFGRILNAQDFDAQLSALSSCMGDRMVIEAQVRRDNRYKTGRELQNLLESARPNDIFTVPHAATPSFPLQLKIDGYVVIDAKFGRGTPVTPLGNNDNPISKHQDIDFQANLHNIPDYDIIKWQVVNTGVYAAHARQLRGEIGSGRTRGVGLRHHEQTLYSGSHWVRCFVMKEGACIAKSEPFVVNIQ